MHLEYGRGQGPRTPVRFAYNGGDLLTHWGRNKMAAIFQTTFFKWIFLNKNVWISINMSLEFVPRGPINNVPTLVQVMAWRRPGDKPLSEPVMVRVPTHIYASLGLNELKKKIFTLRVDCFTLLLARHLADVSCYIAKPLGTWNRLRFAS